MDESLDDQYLTWLYHQVASVRMKNPARTFWSLIRQLHQKEFVWFVPNDDNRVEDGRDLRYEFIDTENITVPTGWVPKSCSILELLIGLSRRLSMESDGKPARWFWELLENLELHEYNDAYYQRCDHTIVDKILDRVIWRTYNPDGRGGLFPLRDPDVDQREIELWYQIPRYLLERE